MTDTRDKLNEARYFLLCMRNCSESNTFRYNLTAFLSAARSITQIMQKEFAGVLAFHKWYSEKQDEMRKHDIMKYLHEQRRLSYHVRPVRTQSHVSLNLIDHIMVTDSIKIVLSGTGEVKVTEANQKSQQIPASSATIELKYYFEDFAEKDVISICEEDLLELEKLVVDCEKLKTDEPG